MEIINQRVEHRRCGVGAASALKGKEVYAAFGRLYGDTVFPYPGVFKEDMRPIDPDMVEELSGDTG